MGDIVTILTDNEQIGRSAHCYLADVPHSLDIDRLIHPLAASLGGNGMETGLADLISASQPDLFMEVHDASCAVACVFPVMAATEGKVLPSSRQS